MCGITGTLNLTKSHQISEADQRQMLAMVRHRGPDEFGIYLDEKIGMGSARLSIIDLAGGQQPISNEAGTIWIVFNGEIFNYIELRPQLEGQGHQFTTNSDTEVIVHLYENYGADFLNFLNGQYAIALWDTRSSTLLLVRDRLGIRPLFYTQVDGALIFASEIKALLADHRVTAEIDPVSIDQIFTYWSTLTPRTVFKGIYEVPPGHYLQARDGKLTIEKYWQVRFPEDNAYQLKRLDEYIEEFRSLLVDATQIRLRADVPVGAYLSGGLDSSTTAAIIRNYTGNRLDTFSVAFSENEFDESEFQIKMAKLLGTDHHVVFASNEEIGLAFPGVIWHTETPILRTSPAPLYLLSKLVREHEYKVVMTGEGADEFLAGYNIFKEALIRRFWARRPESNVRPLLLKKLYPYIGDLSRSGESYLRAFFGENLMDVDSPFYSHIIRWKNTARTKRFFSENLRDTIPPSSKGSYPVPIPAGFMRWHPLHRAQYLEVSIFLAQYLLSSQGDRVAMAHAVEGRFPFLDYRVVEYCNQLPPELKLRGLTEKYLLKQLARQWLPEEIWKRPKKPYRAPIQKSFFNPSTINGTREILSPHAISDAGLFKPASVQHLVEKAASGARLSETDDMALVGILSSQLVYTQFVSDFKMAPPLTSLDNIKVCDKRRTPVGVDR